jgi:hypothetical protein
MGVLTWSPRVILEQRPELEATAPAVADAIARTLYRAGYL